MEQKEQLEVITFGETMGLIMPSFGQQDFVHALQFQKSFGGAESNVAIGLARLGHQVGWFSRLGEDPFGKVIFKQLRGEGVDVSRVSWSTEQPTGLMLRENRMGKLSVYYYRKNSAASMLDADDLDLGYIEKARILHVTGITAALSTECREALYAAVAHARKHGVKVSFDPNLRLKLWPLDEARQVLLDLAEQADYFLPGWDECQLLFDTKDEGEIMERLQQLSENRVVVVKSKNRETVVVETGRCTSVPFASVAQVVDTVGAGDAFCAGFLSGILQDKSPVEAAELGSRTGAMVIQAPGDWEAFPTLAELEVGHIER